MLPNLVLSVFMLICSNPLLILERATSVNWEGGNPAFLIYVNSKRIEKDHSVLNANFIEAHIKLMIKSASNEKDFH